MLGTWKVTCAAQAWKSKKTLASMHAHSNPLQIQHQLFAPISQPLWFLWLIFRFDSIMIFPNFIFVFFIQCSMDLKLRRCLPYYNLSVLEQSQDNATVDSDRSFLLSILMQKEDSRGNIGLWVQRGIVGLLELGYLEQNFINQSKP